jgi:hypothetical protein
MTIELLLDKDRSPKLFGLSLEDYGVRCRVGNHPSRLLLGEFIGIITITYASYMSYGCVITTLLWSYVTHIRCFVVNK